jgi:hypothetical protein
MDEDLALPLPPIGTAECLAVLRHFRGFSRSDLASRAHLHPDRVAFLEGALDAPTCGSPYAA